MAISLSMRSNSGCQTHIEKVGDKNVIKSLLMNKQESDNVIR